MLNDYFKEVIMDNIQKLRFWLGLGRLIGATQYGLLGTIFVVWLSQILGQQGISVRNMVMSVMAVFLMAVFSSKLGVEVACRYPYKAAWAANAACMIAGITMLLGLSPWLIVAIESAVVFVMDAGFLRTRKALMNRKMYGDKLTIMSNQLDIISNGAYLLGSGLAMVVPCNIETVGIVIIVSAALLLPSNLMQIKILLAMPDIEVAKQ